MRCIHDSRRTAFTLIELLIVVTILGILAAIIVPQFRTMSGDASAAALKTDLMRLRDAIRRYEADHGAFPAVAEFEAQLTMFSDRDGDTAGGKDATHVYGPYLMTIPKMPVGADVGLSSVTDDGDADGFAWLYDATTGEIHAHTDGAEADTDGRLFSAY